MDSGPYPVLSYKRSGIRRHRASGFKLTVTDHRRIDEASELNLTGMNGVTGGWEPGSSDAWSNSAKWSSGGSWSNPTVAKLQSPETNSGGT
jgi:hypothetical protein